MMGLANDHAFLNQGTIPNVYWGRIFVCQMYLIDYLITLVSVRVCVCVCVCLSTDQLSNDYVRNSLPIFTKFCMLLRNVVVSNAVVSGTKLK